MERGRGWPETFSAEGGGMWLQGASGSGEEEGQAGCQAVSGVERDQGGAGLAVEATS